MRRIRWSTLSLLLFFYIEGIRVLFSRLFGVLYDALFAGPFTASAGLIIAGALFAFLLPPFLVPRLRNRWSILAISLLLLLSRLALNNQSPSWRLYAAMSTVFFGTLNFLFLYLCQKRGVFFQVVAALALDQFVRLAGNSTDITITSGWLLPMLVIAALLLPLLWYVHLTMPWRWQHQCGLPWQHALPLGAFLFLELNLLNYPNAIARWTATSYSWQAPLLVLITMLALLPASNAQAMRAFFSQRKRHILLYTFLLLSLTIGYLSNGWLAGLFLLLTQAAILATLRHMTSWRTQGYIATALAGALLFFLLLNFANAFAFTYPYTLAIFRNSGLTIYLLAVVIAGLPLLYDVSHKVSLSRPSLLTWESGLVLLLFAMSGWLARPLPVTHPPADTPLRLATYNIHYGYSTDWQAALPAIADDIAASGADVITLQEVDTGRLTSYMVDDALWLGRRLGMHVVYLPTVEHLTGIALLSRYPLLQTDNILLPSDLEQTGMIHAILNVNGTHIHGYGLWLGLTPPERQQQINAAMAYVQQTTGPGFLGGDFNSSPVSPTYRTIADNGWQDPFHQLGEGDPFTDPAITPRERIDYIWLRELEPMSATVSPRLGSDHRLVQVTCGLLKQ